MAYPFMGADARQHACEQYKEQNSCASSPGSFFGASGMTTDVADPLNTDDDVKPQLCEHCLMPSSSCLCLNQHTETSSAENQFSSEYCSEAFFAVSSLTVDAEIKTEENTSSYEFVSEAYLQPELLKRQEGVGLAENMSYACKSCPKTYSKVSYLNKHYLKQHTRKKVNPQFCEKCSKPSWSCLCFRHRETYACKRCDKAYFSLSWLDRHYLSVHTRKKRSHLRPQLCEQCLKPCSSCLCFEKQIETRPSEKCYVCKLCSTVYMRRSYLNKHYLRDHTCKKQGHVKPPLSEHRLKPLFCQKCSKPSSSCLCVNQYRASRPAEKPYACKSCTKAYISLSLLDRHNLKAHTCKKETFPCEYCSNAYDDLSTLQKHMDEHTERKLFPCKYCSRTFSRAPALRKHWRIHLGGKAYSCEFCSKLFFQDSKLRIHIKTHTGERPYSCHYCSGAFSSSLDLKLHMYVHATERPFSCQFCSKIFSTNCDLLLHMRAHTGEKPYSCDHCLKAFAYHVTLKSHKRKVHKIGEKTQSV